MVRQLRTMNWNADDRNRIIAIDSPLTAGPCQGTISCMKLGASDEYRLNMPKALKAPMLASQNWRRRRRGGGVSRGIHCAITPRQVPGGRASSRVPLVGSPRSWCSAYTASRPMAAVGT